MGSLPPCCLATSCGRSAGCALTRPSRSHSSHWRRTPASAQRTLEAHFRQFVGTSPRVIARRVRLDSVRRQLLAAAPRANVTRIAGAAGFSQPGRFAAEYCRSFGELPSQTLRRARRATQQIDEDIDDEAVRLVYRALTAAFAVAPSQCNGALEDALAAQRWRRTMHCPKSIIAWCQRVQAAQRFRTCNIPDANESCQLAASGARARARETRWSLTLAAGTLTLSGRP
jgi:AraC-like DNA-binding protein